MRCKKNSIRVYELTPFSGLTNWILTNSIEKRPYIEVRASSHFILCLHHSQRRQQAITAGYGPRMYLFWSKLKARSERFHSKRTGVLTDSWFPEIACLLKYISISSPHNTYVQDKTYWVRHKTPLYLLREKKTGQDKKIWIFPICWKIA